MHPDEITPKVIGLKYRIVERMLTDDGKSETLIGVTDNHAFVSHNMGISWKKIDNISASKLYLSQELNEMLIIATTGCGWFLDSEGNAFQEVSQGPLDVDTLDFLSRHPQNPNAVLAWGTFYDWDDFDCDQRKWYYYTKDGGTEWKEMESNKDAGPDLEGPDYEFVNGGAPNLIYKHEENDNTEYALNFFSDSPLEFKKLPFKVSKVPYKNYCFLFLGVKDQKELYVSKDGVNFEHIEFPPPYRTRGGIDGASLSCKWTWSDPLSWSSIFISKFYPPVGLEDKSLYASRLPWTTLFRYYVDSNKMKFILDYCYDYTVVSGEEGIIIANIVTNPQDYQNNNEEPKIRTVITFDDGTNWEHTTGPSGTELSIANSFLLNPLSSLPNDENPSVPGLLIVHGKEKPLEHYMGKSRRDSKFYSSISTYMTKDSGRSWCKINDNAMDWTIGDSGDLIVLHSSLLNHIFYSLDGGMKWHKFNLGLPEFRFALPSYSCESKRFFLQNYGFSNPLCNYYCLSFDPADQS